jgi:hypothetical protein
MATFFMLIQDNYYLEVIARPALLSFVDYSLYGFFDTKEEFALYLQSFAKKFEGAKSLHMKVFNEKNKALIEEFNFDLQSSKIGAIKNEMPNFLSTAESELFIGKYFDIESSKNFRPHYFAEFIIQHPNSRKDSVVLAYFSAINEFVKILSNLNKKIKEDGFFSFTIDLFNLNIKHLVSKSYKMFENGSILVPELETHYINFKNEKDLRKFSLYIWENELTDNFN